MIAVQIKENTLSNVNMFYRDRINIIIGFKKGRGKDQLPRNKEVPKRKNLTLELDRCLKKT